MKKSYVVVVEAVALIVVLLLIISLNNNIRIVGFPIYEDQPSASVGKDTYIRNNSALNFDTDTVLKIGKTAGGLEYRSLIAFDFSEIPEGSTILEAVVQFYATTNNQPSMNISAYFLTSNWTESQATWFENSTGINWAQAGGDYNSAFLLDAINVTDASKYYNFSLTQAVRRWLNGTNDNYGILLVAHDAGNNNLTEFASSDTGTSTQAPLIWVSYTTNAVPTVESVSTNSGISSPINVGQQVNFTVEWSDLESDDAQIFVCNSSTISFPTGCGGTTFCNTSFSSQTQQSCTYTAQASNNRTTPFWVAACDSLNCSLVNQSAFYVNHAPNTTLIAPNGGETVNQSQGNYSVRFNVSDSDADSLMASIYYGESQNSTAFQIVSNLPLSSYCSDIDSSTATTNNCTYPWNSQGIFGTYFLTIVVNDSYATKNDSSDASFNVRSLIDNIPPNITGIWMETTSTFSGRPVSVYANVSDPNINTVWFSINATSYQNKTMSNTTAIMYNGSFVAPAVGIYEFRVYANDTLNNVNDTVEAIIFNVTKPSASPQNELSPTFALPYSVIQVSGELNATDNLTNIYAYLNVPSGFIFLSDYPQNTYVGNFSANETKTARWFISTPLNQTTYTFNITYSDSFSNTWASNNTSTNVTTSFGDTITSLSLTDYPHVAASSPYYVEATFSQNGAATNPDSIEISIYDALNNLVVGPIDMTQKQTGLYNHTYNVPSAQTTGQWQTIVNATLDSVSYYANSFWKLVGALFDVREIQIENSAVDHLNISVEAENVGNNPTDLTLVWNLTRVDNDAVLDFGSETFAVASAPVRWYVYPETDYVGQVKITFVGYYLQTEKAGAFEVFSTTAATGESTPSEGSGGSGGGGGGGAALPTTGTAQTLDMDIDIDDEILIAKNIREEIKVNVENTGKTELTNIVLTFNNLENEYYSIFPENFERLRVGDSVEFTVAFLVSDFTGQKEFSYIVSSDQFVKGGDSKLNVLLPSDYIIAALNRLKEKSAELRLRTSDNKIIKQIDKCDAHLPEIQALAQNEELINAKLKLDEANNCLDIAEQMINKKESTLTVHIWRYDVSIIILVVAALALLVLMFVMYLAIKKFNLLFYAKKAESILPFKSAKSEDFEDKIKRIEERLKG